MARIVLGSYMVRYPLGGMMSWVLQYLVGFHRLGHEIYLFEKAGWENACFDPVNGQMTDDCTYGAGIVDDLLRQFGLIDGWCFVDSAGNYHGIGKTKATGILETADLFIDMGTHGSWEGEWGRCGLRVLIDGEPGFTQMKMENRQATGDRLPEYDHYFTTGRSIGTSLSDAPLAGRKWTPIFHPVCTEILDPVGSASDAPFTSVMNWQSYEPIHYRGDLYGHKDVEFEKFLDLPQHTSARLEQAVTGREIPTSRLENAGWTLRDAQEVTMSYDSFIDYLSVSRGEFGVCKSGYVRLKTGWFSDRSAAYLALGKPVVLQETGFSNHLPCGEGLFAVNTVEEAAAAIDDIQSDYGRHARRARELAVEFLDSRVVLKEFLTSCNI